MMAAVLDAENSTLCLNQTPLQVTFRRMPLAVALGDEASRHFKLPPEASGRSAALDVNDGRSQFDVLLRVKWDYDVLCTTAVFELDVKFW